MSNATHAGTGPVTAGSCDSCGDGPSAPIRWHHVRIGTPVGIWSATVRLCEPCGANFHADMHAADELPIGSSCDDCQADAGEPCRVDCLSSVATVKA